MDLFRWFLLQVGLPLLPYPFALLLAALAERPEGDVQWSVIVTVPEIIFLGIVISISGMKDIYDLRSKSYSGTFHEIIFWSLIILCSVAMMLYGALVGFRMFGVDIIGEDPNFLLPVVLTASMIVLSGVAKRTAIQVQGKSP